MIQLFIETTQSQLLKLVVRMIHDSNSPAHCIKLLVVVSFFSIISTVFEVGIAIGLSIYIFRIHSTKTPAFNIIQR